MSLTTNKRWIIAFIFAFIVLMVDGADLMILSYSLSSLKAEFGLSNLEAGTLGSITLTGMAIGGFCGGWAADRFGRVRTIIWAIVIFSIGTAALGLTQNYTEFAILRFISASGLGAEYVVCNTLLAEYVSTARRTTVLGSLQAGWSVGYLVATLLAGWIVPQYGWRYLYYIAIIPVVLAAMIQKLVKEPDAWLKLKAQRSMAPGTPAHADRGTFKVILAEPGTRRLFLLWSVTPSLLQFGYYGVNNWMPTYLERELYVDFKSMTAFMVGSYIAMILGKVIAGWLADKFGRRALFTLGAIGTAVLLPVIVLLNEPDTIAYMLMIFGFVYGIPFGVNATYMTESFQTRIRGSAVGGAYNIGRIGAAIAPAAIGYLAIEGSIGLGFLVMGGAYFICGLIPAFFIEERAHDPQI
jgi:AAHS family cis,cis-muconate transporter-like MFS transporter